MLNGSHPNKALNGSANGHAKIDGGSGGSGHDDVANLCGPNRKMIQRAIRGRWAIPQALREKIVKGIDVHLDGADAREFASLSKVALEADKFDDHCDRLDAGESTENVGLTYRATFDEYQPPTTRALPETT